MIFALQNFVKFWKDAKSVFCFLRFLDFSGFRASFFYGFGRSGGFHFEVGMGGGAKEWPPAPRSSSPMPVPRSGGRLIEGLVGHILEVVEVGSGLKQSPSF